MAGRFSARLDTSGILKPETHPQPQPSRPWVIASVDGNTPALRDLDLVRLDSVSAPLHELTRLRDGYDCPALFDLPGPETPRSKSLLTATELLIFAAAARFEWVGLRGANNARPPQAP